MTYQAWNNLIYKYYFGEQTDTKVLFHITMQDLIDFAKEENVEIAIGKRAAEFPDNFVKRDFVSKFWYTIKYGNATIKDFEDKIISLKKKCIIDKDYKSLLAIVAVLIMPICENDDLELHGNDYYGHLLPFLRSHGFINKQVKSADNLLNTIGLNKIWYYINEWTALEDLPFKSSIAVSDNGMHHYVRSLMQESLLSPSRLQKFCILFDKGGLAPRVNIENDRLLSAFTNYYQNIDISVSKFKQLVSKEFNDYLITVLRQEYDNWDGTTKIKERDCKTGKVKIESGNTYYSLLLMLDYDINSKSIKFGLHLYCLGLDEMDDMTFITDNTNLALPSVYIRNDGFANKTFYLDKDEFDCLFIDKSSVYNIHEKYSKTIKGRFVVTDYYLLKMYKNKFAATNEFIKGEFYFIAIRNNVIKTFRDWLGVNSAKLIANDVLGNNYSLYQIDCASVDMPQCNYLRFKSEIKCKSVNNIEVKTEEQSNVILLSKLLPAQFEITGVDVANDKIYAVSVNGEYKHASELTYDHPKNLWLLKVFTNVFQLNKGFQLYCNETPIPYGHTYRFSDFILPTSFKEVGLDAWGGTDSSCFSTGLSLPEHVVKANLINWDTLKLQMNDAPFKETISVNYKEKDLLLYAITSASYQSSHWVVSMDFIKAVRDRIMADNENKESKPQSDKYALQNALSDYFRMGYINYAYTDKGLCLTANHPSLILLSPEYKRNIMPGLNGRSIVNQKCDERKFKCLLTGGRTISLINEIVKYQSFFGYIVEIKDEDNILMPQTIYIHAEKRSIFKDLAEKLNLRYQDNIYANALLEKLPSIDEYETQKIISGTERDLFMVKKFRAIDYKLMAELYPERLNASRAISNSETDREYFDKENDFVIFFPGTRDETSVFINKGRMIEVDKYWGHFIGMKKMGAKILIHDEDKAQISMPQQIRLPLLYARALTLLTGKTPNPSIGSRTYSIGVNPCTYASASSPDSILRKLGQC